MPPERTPADLCTLGIANDTYDDWQLWLSPKLISLAERVLRGEIGTQFSARPFAADQVRGYAEELKLIAEWSGGGVVEPQGRVFGLFGDSEDDKNVGSLAVTVGAQVAVSHDGLVKNVGQAPLPMLGGRTGLILFLGASQFVEHVCDVREGRPPTI